MRMVYTAGLGRGEGPREMSAASWGQMTSGTDLLAREASNP